jgi:endo-1,4-beta-xylanase
MMKLYVGVASLILVLSSSAEAQLAKDKCKFLGNVIAGSVPSDYKTYWNQVTPENAGKWESTEPTRDNMLWDGLDVAYNYAVANSLLFKQHNFVWGQQQPDWMANLSAPEQKEEVEEWIKSYCEKYPETDFIDVVNEPLHAVPGYRNALGGAGTTGWDWVIWTFEKARQYCPNAKLHLNDYGIINNTGATTAYLTIINLLKERNLIDGIGEQGHGFETAAIGTLTSNLQRLADTGLPIYITEYDVNLSDDTQQRSRYEEQIKVFWNHESVRGITLWGYRQGATWIPNSYLVRTNGTERPALAWLKSYIPNTLGGTFCLDLTGTEDEASSDINVYPNPVLNNEIRIETTEKDPQIRLMDGRGLQVRELRIQGEEGRIELDVPAGIYILEVKTQKKSVIKKLILK